MDVPLPMTGAGSRGSTNAMDPVTREAPVETER
jgi:hypothetical protein